MEEFAQEDADIDDLRIINICSIGFAGFLRYSELAALKESDLHILPDHMEIFIESSKTDQYRDGAWVVIARTSAKTCPVSMAERYISVLPKSQGMMGGHDLGVACGHINDFGFFPFPHQRNVCAEGLQS